MGIIADDGVAFAMGVMDGLPDPLGLEAPGVDMKDVLEDFMACDWVSEERPADCDAVGDWSLDEDVDVWMGDKARTLASLVGAGPADALEVGVVVLEPF